MEKAAPVLGGVGGYGIGKVTSLAFDDAMARVRETLQGEGFGVLTEIDMAGTLKERIGKDIGGRYVILGACNPHLAHEAVTTEPEIGLLLPCNVVVAETDGGTYVGAVDPRQMLGFVGNKDLDRVAEKARQHLSRAIANVG